MRRFLLAICSFIVSGTLHAAELKFDSFEENYNLVSAELGVDESLRLIKCADGVNRICQYVAFGKIGLLAQSEGISDNIDSVSVILAKDGEALSFLLSAAIIITLQNPGISADDRGSLLMQTLMVTVKTQKTVTDYKFGENYYSSNVVDRVGVFFNAKSRHK